MDHLFINKESYFDGLSSIIQQPPINLNTAYDSLNYQLYVFPLEIPKDDEAVVFSIGPYPQRYELALLHTKNKRIAIKIMQKDVWTSTVPMPLYKWTYLSLEIKYGSNELIIQINEDPKITLVVDEIQNAKLMQAYFIGKSSENNRGFKGFISSFKLSTGVHFVKSPAPDYPMDGVEPHVPLSQPLRSIAELDQWIPAPACSVQVPLIPRKEKPEPKMIHCHDFKGGYLNDKYLQGSNEEHVYNFTYWPFIDIFIYFSHHTITIPPPGWINAAHKNGVKVLGTIITEWEQAEKELQKLVDGKPGEEFYYANKLIDIAEHYGFDGWFFNIECKVEPEYVIKLLEFLEYMTIICHQRIEGSLVLWYDSVTVHGELKWQDALNDNNLAFFQTCDGIFLNYRWNDDKLATTLDNANKLHRRHDVYVGIDVFGRGVYGGGGFNSYQAMQFIQPYDLSYALFAPGWTLEEVGQLSRKKWLKAEEKFWLGRDSTELFQVCTNEWKIIQNGGNGWKLLENDDSRSEIRPKQTRTAVFVTSFDWCVRQMEFDLVQLGFTTEDLDLEPIIEASEWIQGTGPDFKDPYCLKVKLLDGSKQLIHEFSTGALTCTDKWEQKQINIMNYGKGLRHIVWEDSGKSAEYWAGHYGAKIDAPSLIIALKPKDDMKFTKYISPRSLHNRFPLATSFNTGCGPHLFMNGKKVKDGPWNNLFAQEVVPIFDDVIENKTKFKLTDQIAFDGSNSIEIDLSVPKTIQISGDTPISSTTLFKTEYELDHIDELEVSYIMKKTHPDSEGDICLLLNTLDGPSYLLASDTVKKKTKRSQTIVLHPTKVLNYSSEWQRRMFVISKPNPTIIWSIQLLAYHHAIQLTGSAANKVQSFQPNLKIYLGLLMIRDRVEKISNWIEDFTIETNWNSDSLYEGKEYLDYTLKWENLKPNIKFWNVFMDNGSGQYTFLDRSYCTSITLKKIICEPAPQFRVVPVLLDFSL